MMEAYLVEASVAARGAEEAKVDRARLGLLAVGHAVTDSYGQSLLAPLFPEIARRLGLSLGQVGALPVVMGLSSSLAQPLLGWLSDRQPRWCMVALGPLLAAIIIGFVGHAQDYGQLAALLFLSGIGIGAFHPQGAMLAWQAGRGSGLAMSAFTVGGNIGFGLAPVLGGLYAHWFGLERFYLAALPAALFAAVMLPAFYGGGRVSGVGRWHDPLLIAPSPVHPLPSSVSYRALAALTATVVVRSGVQIGMATFLAFLVEERFPPAQHDAVRGLAVSAFLLAGAFAGPVGGILSDRFGQKPVMAWTFLLAPWPMLLAFHLPGFGLIALLALGAFILMLPHPGTVVMAQELMPHRAGIAASLITGLAWGLAQILAMPLGYIAEQTSLSAALTGLCLTPLLGALLVLPIPASKRAIME